MPKVKLLKDHLDNKEGEVMEVSEERANYFQRCGVAEEVKEEEKKAPTKKGK